MFICCAWVFPGLVGHDPWKPYEAPTFGVIFSNLQGANWLIPSIAGQPYLDSAPLYSWLGTLSAHAFSWLLPAHDAARLATGFCMVLTITGVYFAALELNGSRISRIAVVLMLGTIGLVVRGHLMGPDVAGLAGMACGMYGLAAVRRRPQRGVVWLTLGITAAGLGSGWLAAFILILACMFTPILSMHWCSSSVITRLAIACVIAIAAIAAWPLYLSSHDLNAVQWLLGASGSANFTAWFSESKASFNPWFFLKTGVWYLLPVWPLALLNTFKHRDNVLTAPETALPLVVMIVGSVLILALGRTSDATLLLLVVPLTLLAVPSIDRVPRSVTSFLEWFGLATFGLCVFLIWAAWLGYTTGIPRNAARWVARMTPGYQYEAPLLLAAFALLLTLIWIAVVRRANRSNRRAIVNWTAGLTAVWLLVSALGLNAVNYAASHRATFTSLRAQWSTQGALPSSCVVSSGLGDSQRALLHYYTGVITLPQSPQNLMACPWLLVQTQPLVEVNFPSEFEEVWRGARPADKAEQFRLYRKR